MHDMGIIKDNEQIFLHIHTKALVRYKMMDLPSLLFSFHFVNSHSENEDIVFTHFLSHLHIRSI